MTNQQLGASVSTAHAGCQACSAGTAASVLYYTHTQTCFVQNATTSHQSPVLKETSTNVRLPGNMGVRGHRA